MTDFAMKTPNGMLDPSKLLFPTFTQPKLDGLRGICVARPAPGGPVVHWFSYSGKPLWNLENVTAHLGSTASGVYDGEITWPGHPFSDAYGLCKRQKPDPKKYPDHERAKSELRFNVFDHLGLDEWDARRCYRTLEQRILHLHRGVRSEMHPVVQFMGVDRVDSLEEFHRMHDIYLKAGHEGTMVKNPHGLYHWKRHPDWHRWKPTQTIDVKILGAIEGKGKWAGALGAFMVQMPDGTECKAGGGRIDLATRKEWWRRRFELIGGFVEVEAKLVTKGGAMREPILIRLREDKS